MLLTERAFTESRFYGSWAWDVEQKIKLANWPTVTYARQGLRKKVGLISDKSLEQFVMYLSQIVDSPIMHELVYSILGAPDSRPPSTPIQPCNYLILGVFICISLFTLLLYHVGPTWRHVEVDSMATSQWINVVVIIRGLSVSIGCRSCILLHGRPTKGFGFIEDWQHRTVTVRVG